MRNGLQLLLTEKNGVNKMIGHFSRLFKNMLLNFVIVKMCFNSHQRSSNIKTKTKRSCSPDYLVLNPLPG